MLMEKRDMGWMWIAIWQFVEPGMRAPFTLPWRGRVGEQLSCEPGWGECSRESPHPDARFTRVDPPPPGEGAHRARGEVTQFVTATQWSSTRSSSAFFT